MGGMLLFDWAVASVLNDGRSISAQAFSSIHVFIGGCCLLLVSILFLLIGKFTLIDMSEHFYAYSTCCKEIGDDGKERDRWSFSSGHSYSWIGRNIGPIAIFFAQIKHNRLVVRSNKAVKAAD
jgi:hypothetical protein